jgi:hypothetical protein
MIEFISDAVEHLIDEAVKHLDAAFNELKTALIEPGISTTPVSGETWEAKINWMKTISRIKFPDGKVDSRSNKEREISLYDKLLNLSGNIEDFANETENRKTLIGKIDVLRC